LSPFVFDSDSTEATDRLAQALIAVLPRRATIALNGTLGAGKTRFVQGLAAAAGIDPATVTSPTFVLCQQYTSSTAGQRRLYHLDAYRLHDVDEFRELGTEELYDEPALTLIEWADKIEPALPDSYLLVRIDVTGPTSRRFTISAVGDELASLPDRLAQSA
jgi:tRNA threonylcarbamoyladenosine biosynthesis protein TsaE